MENIQLVLRLVKSKLKEENETGENQ